jgi:trimethylamine---corrinoid protein Co-methyltransferase
MEVGLVSYSLQATPRFQLFSREQCEAVHLATLDILRRTGTRVYQREARDLLKEAGCLVSDETLVKYPPSLVEWAIKQAPSTISLCERGGSRAAFKLEAMNVAFGTGSDCRNYIDPRSGEYRLFRAADVVDCIRLVDACREIDFCMSMGIPSDVDAIKPYAYQFSLMLLNTAKPIVFIADDLADCKAIVAMAAASAGGYKELELSPNLLCYSQVTTPLIHNEESTDKLIFMAEKAVPVVHQPSPMMGGTAPMSMAGGLVIGNAEVLSSLVIHQLKRQGAPFLYGGGQHHIDMQTTISVYSAPEFDLERVAVAEMARYYNLPSWGYAGCTDSCIFDEHAAADASLSIMTALLSGQNLVHDIGYMEAGLTFGPEMVLYADEIISRTKAFTRGISLDKESLALDLIDEVGPGGAFLTTEHTFNHFRDFWQPKYFNRRRRDDWVNGGSKTMGTKLREKVVEIMENHRPEEPSTGLREEIDYILKQSGQIK